MVSDNWGKSPILSKMGRIVNVGSAGKGGGTRYVISVATFIFAVVEDVNVKEVIVFIAGIAFGIVILNPFKFKFDISWEGGDDVSM